MTTRIREDFFARFREAYLSGKSSYNISKMFGDTVSKNAQTACSVSREPRIYLSKTNTKFLFSKIGKCEVNCFDYKWR